MLVDTPLRTPPNIDMLSPPEFQTGMVDSMTSPHAAEYVSTQLALAQDCATLQLIDDDIEECRRHVERAYAQMRLLERRRDAVQRRVSIHRARLSPWRAIPDQVLQEIFRHCLPDTPYVVPDGRFAPLVLTHVCRRWRAVAQGTSELWSSIALYDRGVWNYELEVEMVKRWLDRSRARAIRMSITCLPYTPGRSVSASDIFQLAIAHRAQLRDLCLDVDQTYLRHFMDRANLPALRSIIISLHPGTHQTGGPLKSNTLPFMTAPNLRRITFKGSVTSIYLIPRTLFPQITHLSLDSNTTPDLALLFQDFPDLHHLTLALSLSHETLLPPQSDPRILVPSLVSLEIRLDEDMLRFGDPEKLATLLDQLELPALRTLSIAAPLRPRFDAQTGRTEACWENHLEWVRSPSVASLLSRSRFSRPRFECLDIGSVVPDTGCWNRVRS